MNYFEVFKEVPCGDMTVLYVKGDDNVGFTVVPTSMRGEIPEHQNLLNDSIACRGISKALKLDVHAARVEPLINIRIQGDSGPGPLDGCTLRSSSTNTTLKFVNQETAGNTVRTLLRNENGLEVTHILTTFGDKPYFEVSAEFHNGSSEEVILELLESFSLGLLSPFQPDSGIGKYRFYRFLSNWSAEGRVLVETPEQLNMEPAWLRCGGRAHRFGQRSSMPVKEYFPSCAFEDTDKGVIWAVQLGTLGPWQMEFTRITDGINLSGGFPDAEFGGWERKVKPGETFPSMPAVLTCVKGSLWKAFSRLTRRPVDQQETTQKTEADLPLMFNEFCTTWCNPYPNVLAPILKRMKGTPVRYFTLDDGWFTALGDWDSIKTDKYPDGFGAFIDTIRANGMIPGLWFEMEHCIARSKVAKEHPELLLTRYGKIVSAGGRNILDLRKKAVWDYLDATMCKVIRTYGIGYIKMDYNASITGADTDNGSTAYGVQEYVEAVRAYFRHLKAMFPELVLEICASGGHRLSSEWMKVGAMASFSDAHESRGIPLIAANTMFQIPMCRNQIWATLRPADDNARLTYSLSAGFLGRLCVSGYVADLNETQFALVERALEFYSKAKPYVRNSTAELDRRLTSESYEDPRGCQIVSCTNECGTMFVTHTFGNAPETLEIDSPKAVSASFLPDGVRAEYRNGKIVLSGLKDFQGIVLFAE